MLGYIITYRYSLPGKARKRKYHSAEKDNSPDMFIDKIFTVWYHLEEY